MAMEVGGCPAIMLRLDNDGPLYAQVYRAIRAEILRGGWAPGAKVPPTRLLAAELGVSRNVVLLSYEQLISEGYMTARTGAGTFVAPELPENLTTVAGASVPSSPDGEGGPPRLSAFARRVGDEAAGLEFNWEPRRSVLPYDFRYGRPSLTDFPHETWCRLLARRARRASIRDLDYGPVQGVPELRHAIADYLRRARGISSDTDRIIIVNGSQQALDLAARVLIDSGDRVVIEEPHYRAARVVMAGAGARLSAVAVDEHGLRVEDAGLAGDTCQLVVVTPSHQFPTGAVMPLSRRLELLDFVRRSGAYIFEDDYDSEYRYSGRPVEALYALDRASRVIYAATFSKLMFPALRVGYVVLPEQLVEPFRSAKALTDTGNPTLPQLALIDFIREGHFERHVRRLRARNAARREALLEAVEQNLGDRVTVSGENAGLHVLLWMRDIPFSRTAEVRERARRMGVGVYSVGPFYTSPPDRVGLVIGYASLTEAEIRHGIRRLATALASL